jgi:hypothetical protein
MTRLVDDIDGSQAVTTLSFSLDGLSYEIDLSESHLDAFRQALAPFVSVARNVPGGRRAREMAAPPQVEPEPPAPKRAPRRNGHAVPTGDGVTEATTARPAAVKPTAVKPAAVTPAAVTPSAVNSPPFQQPELGRGSTAAPERSKPDRAPLVADPFNPGAHR